MTREEAKEFLIDVSYKLGNMAVEYLTEKDGEKMLEAIKALEQEPCGDAISRQAVLELVADYDLSMGQVVRGIHALPSVTPQEPKTGHWIKTPKAVMGEGYMWYCDKCEHQVYQDSSRPYPSERYCPNCGAKMESEE